MTHDPSFFYLRLPSSGDLNSPGKRLGSGFPVSCVAVQAGQWYGQEAICFAVSTYNPLDQGILPYSKKTAKARAAGRLNSEAQRILLKVDEAYRLDFSKGIPSEVVRAICLDMTNGYWLKQHPAAAAAYRAAKHWLDTHSERPQPPIDYQKTDEASHLGAWEDDGGAHQISP
jgi:hypothetical protein